MTESNRTKTASIIAASIIAASITADLEPLSDCREQLARCLFEQIQDPTNCIHHILPPKVDDKNLAKLRHPKLYLCPQVKTSKYQKSFLINALRHFQ
jgi:hypothetical protein